jgi:uncharacterized sulfatase
MGYQKKNSYLIENRHTNGVIPTKMSLLPPAWNLKKWIENPWLSICSKRKFWDKSGRAQVELLFVFLFILIPFLPVQAQSRPNIVLFMADDMAWHDCGAYGSKQVHTPNIDRLASEGMRFKNMFTSTAMCSPTRQQILTGLWPVRNGAYPNHSWVYDSVKTLPYYLRELGYRTALAGKGHIGPDQAFPFERLTWHLSEEGSFEKIQAFVNRNAAEPFFLLVASDEPHGPWTKGDESLYDPEKVRVPGYLVDTKETRRDLSKYFAEVTYMDDEVGKCIRVLEESGQKDNTIFIFTSEQGTSFPFAKWTCYDHGLKTAFIVRWPEKVKEGSVSDALVQYVDLVPTLLDALGVKWRKVNPGVVDGNGRTLFDGESFLDVLWGATDEHRKYVFGIHTTRGILDGSESYAIRSIRSRQFLYVRNLNFQTDFTNLILVRNFDRLMKSWQQAGQKDEEARERAMLYRNRPYEELYRVSDDPDLKKNRAQEERFRAIKQQLGAQLNRWMSQQGDYGVATEMAAHFRQEAFLKKNPDTNFK